jgi:Fe-S cluster assembly ATPase SufC
MLRRLPARWSGGEAMRVTLIGALLSDADFLIPDEPSNHLDLPSVQALETMLRSYEGAPFERRLHPGYGHMKSHVRVVLLLIGGPGQSKADR